jgi:hypothetical protein
MDRQYDLFEKMDGELVWKEAVVGHTEAVKRLQELGATSSNEFVLMHLASDAVIAVINSPAV